MKLTRENALVCAKEKAEIRTREKLERIAENKKVALKEQMKVNFFKIFLKLNFIVN